MKNLRATFKCEHYFPTLRDLRGVESIEHAASVVYPHAIIETGLSHNIGDNYEPVIGYKGLVRDDGKQLACVRDSYEVVQPIELMSQFEPFIQSGLVSLVAGGSLQNGTRISLIGKINGTDREIVKGEGIAAFVNFYGGLDGSLGIGGSLFGLQVRCLNGVCVMNNKLNLKTRHTKNVRVRLDNISDQIAKAIRQFDDSTKLYKQLAEKKMLRNEQISYIANVFEIDAESEELHGKSEAKLNRVIELLDTQKGLDLVPAVRGTAWQAYSAITEYLTYEAGNSDETRLNSRLFGQSANINKKALTLALNA